MLLPVIPSIHQNMMSRLTEPFEITAKSTSVDRPDRANIDKEVARENINYQATDMHQKLKCMQSINIVVIVHNDVLANRLSSATLELLQKVDEMFKADDKGTSDKKEGSSEDLQKQRATTFQCCRDI